MASPGAGMVSSIGASADGVNLFVGTGDGASGSTYRSVDSGLTWQQVEAHGLKDAPGQVLFAYDDIDSDHAFSALGSGTLLETRDAGATWKTIRT